MAASLLKVDQLHVNVEEKEILHGVDLEINKGETHVLMGPNGAGKSTLGYALMGNPRYEVTEGAIYFNGKDITKETPAKRAKDGIFLSFQNPIEVPGITLGNFIRTALEQRTGKRIRLWEFKKELKKAMEVLQMDESYAERDLNVGFSGGEKKKAEILAASDAAPVAWRFLMRQIPGWMSMRCVRYRAALRSIRRTKMVHC